MADRIGRRSFLKRAAGAVALAVGAPLFIPAERLGFGVPTGRLATPTDAEVMQITSDWMPVNQIIGGEVTIDSFVKATRGTWGMLSDDPDTWVDDEARYSNANIDHGGGRWRRTESGLLVAVPRPFARLAGVTDG